MNQARFQSERNLDIVETVVAVAAELGVTPSQVALAWVASQPGVTAPIFGARTLEQLEDNLVAADLALPKEAQAKLDAVSKLDLVYPYDFHERVKGITAALTA
jgi:aryl-alcohol dehydrogenase-like predicted oxidoreductase